jgi:hypothetical protein
MSDEIVLKPEEEEDFLAEELGDDDLFDLVVDEPPLPEGDDSQVPELIKTLPVPEEEPKPGIVSDLADRFSGWLGR